MRYLLKINFRTLCIFGVLLMFPLIAYAQGFDEVTPIDIVIAIVSLIFIELLLFFGILRTKASLHHLLIYGNWNTSVARDVTTSLFWLYTLAAVLIILRFMLKIILPWWVPTILLIVVGIYGFIKIIGSFSQN